MRLKGRYAVVTGAAGGIGDAVCRLFQAEGARIAALDRAAPAAGELRLTCDLADDASVGAAAGEIVAAGTPDIVIHAAAVDHFGGVLDTAPADYLRLYDINVCGAVRLLAALAPGMREAGRGSIVLVASINALYATPTLAAYAASKAALVNLGETLALELAPAGVRVNTICPASIDTPMLRHSFARNPDPDAARQANVGRHPLGRLGTPEDAARLALFLASDEAGWITGATHMLDGGAGVTRR